MKCIKFKSLSALVPGIALSIVCCVHISSNPEKTSPKSSQSTGALKVRMDKLLKPWVNETGASQQCPALIAAVSTPYGEGVFAYGTEKIGSNKKATEVSPFGIASVTKLFTALLLAKLEEEERVRFQDLVVGFYPGKFQWSGTDKAKITLEQLATHFSGWPQQANNFDPFNPKTYTEADFYQGLEDTPLSNVPGQGVLYSNLAYGILGHTLSNQFLHTTFEDAVRTHILDPLEMNHTDFDASNAQMIQGYESGKSKTPVPFLELPEYFKGAGAMVSTGNDMLKLLKALIHPESLPSLSGALKTILVPKVTNQQKFQYGMATEIGFFKSQKAKSVLMGKGGGTRGFTIYVLFDAKAEVGSVLMCSLGAAEGSAFINKGAKALIEELLDFTGEKK